VLGVQLFKRFGNLKINCFGDKHVSDNLTSQRITLKSPPQQRRNKPQKPTKKNLKFLDFFLFLFLKKSYKHHRPKKCYKTKESHIVWHCWRGIICKRRGASNVSPRQTILFLLFFRIFSIFLNRFFSRFRKNWIFRFFTTTCYLFKSYLFNKNQWHVTPVNTFY